MTNTMASQFGLKEQDLKNIISIISAEKAVEQAYVFGSRAKGNFKTGSDVDIALKGSTLTSEQVLHISYLLNQETLMPYKFDILNYFDIDNKSLSEHIDRIGIIIYEK